MKKRLNLSFNDIGFIEIADILLTLWFVGLLINWGTNIGNFIARWRWALFAIAIIIGIKPIWKVLYGARSAEGLPKKRAAKKKVVKKRK